mgnify:CR=1 FL=1
MMEGLGYAPYESYKDSHANWLGEVPTDWQVGPGRICIYENKDKNTGMKESTVLSLSYGRVIVKDEDKMTGLVPESYETYQIVQPGDIIIRGTDLQNDVTSLRTGLAKDHGIITSAYINLRPKPNAYAEFLHYLLHSYDVKKVFYGLGSGLRQNLSYVDFKYLTIPLPSLPQQRAIAAFLDDKCAKIDRAVKIKEDQIALLRERRQIIIQDAVTRGLNPAAPMKDSGIDWIGQIPAHWDVKRGKFLFAKVERPVRIQDDIVTCFRDGQVTLRSNRRTEGFTNALQEHGYQGIRKGDLVIHAMDAFAGAIGVSDSDGKATPVYSVCVPRIKNTVDPPFFAQLMRQIALSGLLVSLAKGIRERSTDFRYGDFASLLLVVPPLSEQKEITAYIQAVTEKIENGIAIKERQIAALKEYKTSLINAAVTGKIKVI